MNVTIGSGKVRRVVTLPSVPAARVNNKLRVEREKGFEALKNFIVRPAVLNMKGN